MNYFAIGDIHGCDDKLMNLLKHWNVDNEELIFLGDLIDKGPNSLAVIRTIMNLSKKYGAKVVMGNHDEMFLIWLDNTDTDSNYYLNAGGAQTLKSFFGKDVAYKFLPTYLAKQLNQNFLNEIEFMRGFLPYYETDKHIFVHAGVDLNLKEDWKKSSENALRVFRNPFIYGKNETGKTIVFGHTTTREIHLDKSDDVWFSPCGTKIGIDGAAVSGGMLHGLKIYDKHYIAFSV